MMSSYSDAESFYSAQSSTDTNKIMPASSHRQGVSGSDHHDGFDPTSRYVHVFEGGVDDDSKYLFVRNLGPSDIYQTQLVLKQNGDGTSHPMVRKVFLRRTLQSLRDTEVDKLYNNDVEMTKRIFKAFSDAGVEPPIAKVLSQVDVAQDNHDKYFRVSYWSYPNGGSLRSFLETCYTERVIVSITFALNILRQLFEMLDHMYSLEGPIFHMAISSDTIHLHFDPGALGSFPNVILTDLSRAEVGPFPGRAGWDIPDVVELIRAEFPSLTDIIDVLNNLHIKFLTNRTHARYGQNSATPISFTIPSLYPVLSALNDKLAYAEGEWNDAIRFRALINRMGIAPVQPQTYDGISEILEVTGVHGPWQVGEFDANTGKVEVLSRKGSRGYHRPNDENDDSESDNSIAESGYEVVEEEDCDEDGGWVLTNEGSGAMQELPDQRDVARRVLDRIWPRH